MMGKMSADNPGLSHNLWYKTKRKLPLWLIWLNLEMESDWSDFGHMPVPEPVTISREEVHWLAQPDLHARSSHGVGMGVGSYG